MESRDEGFPIGAILLDRYRIEKEIDAGAMSHVYFSKDQWQSEIYAIIKTPIAKLLEDEWIIKKFKQEAESLARLNHPNIVKLLGHGKYENQYPFVILEYVEGKPLSNIMKELPCDLQRAAKFFLQIAQAVDYAHSQQIFHRDLKPDNIMVQRPGEPEESIKIIDFGIARIGNSFFATGENTRYQVGTPFYLSPNRLRHEPDDRADDIYALGLIAYEMVSGINPLSKARNFDQLKNIQEQMLPPRRVNPDLPKEVSQEIVRALSLNQVNRHSSALEFGNRFHAPFFKVKAEEPVNKPIEKPGDAVTEVLINFNNQNPVDEIVSSKGDFHKQSFDEAELLSAISAGERFLLLGDFESAIAFYDEKIALNEVSDLFYSRRAMALLMKKDYEQAALDCQKAIKINSKNDFAYLIRGIIYRLKLWTVEAESDLLKAIQNNPNNLEAALILGDIHASRGEIEKALSYYTHICRINRHFSWVYTSRGNLYYDKQDYEAAIKDFTLGIKTNPELAWNFYRRAKALTKNGVNEQAIKDLTEAIALSPKNTTFYNERARFYFKIGNHTEAFADFNRVKELSARSSFVADEQYSAGIDKKSGLASLVDYLKLILMGESMT